MARTIQRKVRARTARTGRRAFSLVELLVVVAILGIILAIAVGQASKSFRRAKVDSIADTIRNFIQDAGAQVQKQNLPVFIELSWVAAPSPGFYRFQAIADSLTNGVLDGPPYNPIGTIDATKDSIVAQYDVPSEIALSGIVGAAQIESTLWSTNTADQSTRSLLCDFQRRTINPTSGGQIAGVATLSVSHVNMLQSSGQLKPLINDQIRINPIWSARILRTVK